MSALTFPMTSTSYLIRTVQGRDTIFLQVAIRYMRQLQLDFNVCLSMKVSEDDKSSLF